MWRDHVPLFVTGTLASLRLGPGAGNLEGARLGAERIAWSIGELLEDKNVRTDDRPDGIGEAEIAQAAEYRYYAGKESRFSSLSEE